MGALPLDLALSSVLAARLDGAARPALLAAVARIPAPRAAADDAAPGEPARPAREPEPAEVAGDAQPELRFS